MRSTPDTESPSLGVSLLLLMAFAPLPLGGCDVFRENESAREPSGAPVVLTATPPPARLGEYAKTPYFRVRVLNSKPCVVEAHFAPPPGTKKVAVEVELEASSELEIPSNPFYALLTDVDGRQYESTLAGCTPVLPATRLTGGQSSVRGWITFDLPEAAVPRTLVYQPAVIGLSAPRTELQLVP